MGTFSERMTHLVGRVGEGDLVGSVVVDQVYARYQELGYSFRHPRGGQAEYLSTALYSVFQAQFEEMARELLELGPVPAMKRGVEEIVSRMAAKAPREFANLSLSGHPTVTDNGDVVYDRPPVQHRLSEEELRELCKLRYPAHALHAAAEAAGKTKGPRLAPFGNRPGATPFGHAFYG